MPLLFTVLHLNVDIKAMYKTIKINMNALKNNKIFELLVGSVIIISALEIGAKTFN